LVHPGPCARRGGAAVSDDALYVIHIAESIDLIEHYVSEGKQVFLGERKTQDAVLRNLQTLAESSQRLSAELKARYEDVDWAGIAGFRHVLVHDYLGVNLERVWEIIEGDLPELKRSIVSMREEFGV